MNIPAPSSNKACSNNVKNSTMSCTADDLVVHFRPHWSYQGEFGFDWLRVNDIVADQKKPPYVVRHQVLAEPPYKDCLAGGLKSGHCWQSDPFNAAPLPYDKAYIDLNLAYRSFRVKRKGYDDRYNNGNYFIPYLNLYDKQSSQEIARKYKQTYGIAIPVAPPYQATLRLFANAAGSPPLMVVVEFDPTYFNLTGGVIRASPEDAQKKQLILPKGIWFNPDKPLGRNKELPSPITISCERELDTDQDINVYAYYPGADAKILAGRLCVCANGKNVRKTLPMVVVNVKTNTQQEVTGNLSAAEINALYHFLYQALIYPELVTTYNQQRIVLDLTNDPNFLPERVDPKTKKTLPQGGFIDEYGNLIDTNEALSTSVTVRNRRSTHDYLKQTFDKIYGEFKAHFPIFAFGIPSFMRGSLGLVKKIGIKNLILTEATVKVGTRAYFKPFTCAHEVYHGLGVDHAHLNQYRQDLKKYGTQFVYYGAKALRDESYPVYLISEYKSTDNLMGYKQTANSTWRWQWQIVQSNV